MIHRQVLGSPLAGAIAPARLNFCALAVSAFGRRQLGTRTALQRPHGFQDFVKSNGFHCLMLVVALERQAVWLARSGLPKEHFGAMRRTSGEPVALARVWWMPGKPVTSRIATAFERRFQASWHVDGSFSVPVREAALFVEQQVSVLGTWSCDDGGLVALMDERLRRHCRVPEHAPSPLRGLRTPAFRSSVQARLAAGVAAKHTTRAAVECL